MSGSKNSIKLEAAAGKAGVKDGLASNESGPVRKMRLGGGAARGSLSTQALGSPLRVLVTSIGQKIAGKTSGRKRVDSSTAATKLSSLSAATSGGKLSSSSSAAVTPPNEPSTPSIRHVSSVQSTFPKRQANLGTPGSKVASVSAPMPLRKQMVHLTPGAAKTAALSSSRLGTKDEHSSTPLSRHSSAPLKTPGRKEANPSTPVSRRSSLPPRTPGRTQIPLNTPAKGSSIPHTSPMRRHQNPSTPVSKQSSVPPTTPVSGENSVSTPQAKHSTFSYHTPIHGTTHPSPLQLRSSNAMESSRKLHFGIDLTNVDWQRSPHRKDNAVLATTPKADSSILAVSATYSFDRNRLAVIKARQSSQLLKSPALRVRVDPQQAVFTHKHAQMVAESKASSNLESADLNQFASPARKRVDKSLW